MTPCRQSCVGVSLVALCAVAGLIISGDLSRGWLVAICGVWLAHLVAIAILDHRRPT